MAKQNLFDDSLPWYVYGIGILFIVESIIKFLETIYLPLFCIGIFAIVIYWRWKEAQKQKEYEAKLDNPEPIIYNLHAEGVWAQVDKALKIIPPAFEDLSVYINYSDPNPTNDQPLFIQASLTLFRSDLLDSREDLPTKHRSLKSKIILYAYIRSLGERCELTLLWACQPICTRLQENIIIVALTAYIDRFIKEQINLQNESVNHCATNDATFHSEATPQSSNPYEDVIDAELISE